MLVLVARRGACRATWGGGLAVRTTVVAMFAVFAITVAPANAASGSPFLGRFTSVSCASAGNCTAVGKGQVTTFSGNSSTTTTSMAAVTEAGGVWGSVVVPPVPADSGNYSQGPDLDSVACPAAGSCDASGAYLTAPNGAGTALFEGERSGTWSQPTAEAVPTATNGQQIVDSTKIACGGVG